MFGGQEVSIMRRACGTCWAGRAQDCRRLAAIGAAGAGEARGHSAVMSSAADCTPPMRQSKLEAFRDATISVYRRGPRPRSSPARILMLLGRGHPALALVAH